MHSTPKTAAAGRDIQFFHPLQLQAMHSSDAQSYTLVWMSSCLRRASSAVKMLTCPCALRKQLVAWFSLQLDSLHMQDPRFIQLQLLLKVLVCFYYEVLHMPRYRKQAHRLFTKPGRCWVQPPTHPRSLYQSTGECFHDGIMTLIHQP